MPIRSITNPKLSLNVLSDDEVRRIHEATLSVLERTGVRFPSALALEILSAHGAQVDAASQVVKFPAGIVEEYLAKAPPAYTLAALDPTQDLPLDGNHSHLATDGCGVEIIDAFTGERRRARKQDLADIARVADTQNAIAFHWVPLSAQDCPPNSHSLHELEAIWSNSSKHVQTEELVTPEEMHAAVEMAAVLVGGREALRQRPVLSVTQCTISPLAQDGGPLEAALVAAEAGVPVGFMTMTSCGSTGPATLAGNLVMGNAEVLSALVLMQMAHPGSPVYYAAAQTATDMRTGGYTGGGPEDYLFGAASNRLADFYRVPLSMGAFATGAKVPDWQAALDNSLSGFMAVSTLADMLLGAGLLHGSRIFSYEQLLMDCEIWSILHHLFKGIVVNDDTLALDAIHHAGPGGNFLAERHTLKHMRELWQPTLLDRRPYSQWEIEKDGAREWAGERARKLLRETPPRGASPEQVEGLRQVIRRFEG